MQRLLLSLFRIFVDSMEQREGRTKTTNADRCIRYREKNAEKYKIKQITLCGKSEQDCC